MRVLHALEDIVDSGAVGTVARVADRVGTHPNGVRRHLEALAAAGLVATVDDTVDEEAIPVAEKAAPGRRRGSRRGRPSVRYAVTAAGWAATAGTRAPISADYLGMTAAFADHLAWRSSFPATEAREVGLSWGRALARGRDDARAGEPRPTDAGEAARDRVVDLLQTLGFSPRRRTGSLVALRTCPLLDAARTRPDVLCQVHLGLVRGASAAYGGRGEGGQLTPFAEPGACLLELP